MHPCLLLIKSVAIAALRAYECYSVPSKIVPFLSCDVSPQHTILYST
uniref:Uncharacterized protein n=1 Tax=Rhizophora mucronata TaxID=61149 RepID=A0A2P2PE05_RHIMU